MTPTHYPSDSHGGPIPIKGMATPHLERTIAKLQRKGGLVDLRMVGALQAELATRTKP